VRPLWTLLLCALAAPAEAATLADVQACMQKNAPSTAIVQTVALVSTDRAGGERRYEAKLMAKRLESGLGRVRVQVEEPADVRGTAFLLIQNEGGRSDMYVYLPELKKVRSITSRTLRGKFLGSDFSYEDLERLLSASRQADASLGADAEKDGRKVWTVEATPAADAGSGYSRIVSSVDQETCVPVEIAFYGKGEAPAKVLSVDPARITKEGAVHVPRSVRMRDVDGGTESRLETLAVEVDPELKDVIFSRGALDRGR
jgi:Outer membrane lipoprotein-sorting protein